DLLVRFPGNALRHPDDHEFAVVYAGRTSAPGGDGRFCGRSLPEGRRVSGDGPYALSDLLAFAQLQGSGQACVPSSLLGGAGTGGGEVSEFADLAATSLQAQSRIWAI